MTKVTRMRLGWGVVTLAFGAAGWACSGAPDAPIPSEAATPTHEASPSAAPDAGIDDAGGAPHDASGRGDASAARDAGIPASHPQVVRATGSVVASPKVLAMTFKDDPLQAQIDSFTAKMATSGYWSQTTSEYGVGPLVARPAYHSDKVGLLSGSDSAVETWLRDLLTSNAVGAPDPSTLYAVYLTRANTGSALSSASCGAYTGYHSELAVAGTRIGYAVIPRCDVPGESAIDTLTTLASKQHVHWATNPFPKTAPAYADVDSAHAIWKRLYGAEVGDMCLHPYVAPAKPAGLGFAAQRTWSNQAAAAGHHPCVPSAEVFFAAAPVLPESLPIPGSLYDTRGVRVAVGASKTIPVVVHADGAMGPVDLQVLDVGLHYHDRAEFTYALGKTSAMPGETVQLTITGFAPATKGKGFVVVAKSGARSWAFPAAAEN